jgi:Flp pilus assembly protein TadG
VVPVLLLILMGIIDFGRVFYTYMVLNAAARDSARYASVGASDSQVKSTIQSDTPTLDYSQESITIQPSDGYRVSGLPVTVSISYPVQLLTPVLSSILPDPFVVKTSITMRVE